MDDEHLPRLPWWGPSVIWCPAAYLQLGISDEAPCRLPELREKGGTVALGMDGALNGVNGDAAHCAYLIAASVRKNISPAGIIQMETIDAAGAAGLQAQVGRLAVRQRAEVVICSTG